jgi:glucokinase
MSYWIGVDVGGTNIVSGLVNQDGQVLDRAQMKTNAPEGPDAVLERIAEAVLELSRRNPSAEGHIGAIGIGVPGLVDPARGVSLYAANLGWRDYPVAELLSVRLGIPVYIHNDVKMYIYGEAVHGAARGARTVFGLTLGTGIAAAIIDGGRIYEGGGLAGEIGHVVTDGVPFRCGCGLVGCLEAAVSASGITRQARAALASGRESMLGAEFPDAAAQERLTAADVSRAFDAGDALAGEILAHTGRLLGRALAHSVALCSPDIVVIGGGVAHAGERILAPTVQALRESLYPGLWERVTFTIAEHIDNAGVIGSAAYARQQTTNRGE